MGEIARVRTIQDTPMVSVIIPSRDGYRDGCVPRLLETVEKQSFQGFETLLVKGVSPQGKAINLAAREARGSILIILDDDSRLVDEKVFARLFETLESDSRIGMAGASIVVPPEANHFQRAASLEFPRFNTPVVDDITDSDLACHGCCAIPIAVFQQVGGEREDIIRGLDPDLRVRLRNAGYRVVLAPHAAIYHPLPEDLRKLVKVFFRNGFGSAYAWKFEPNSVFETHEQLDSTDFKPKTSLIYRIVRFPFRLLSAMVTGRWLRFAAYSAYAMGYVWGLCTARREAIHAGG
jgi:GT2 family glycosyltransferase